jgi:hypothetical protein
MEPRQQYKANKSIFNLHKWELLPPTKNGTARCKAIYIGNDYNPPNIEVIIMKWSPPHPLYGGTEYMFALPSTENWGNVGWSFRDLDAAEIKYNNINLNDEEE